MLSTLRSTEATNPTATHLLHPLDVIDAMIELRIQLQQVERQIASLQPTLNDFELASNP